MDIVLFGVGQRIENFINIIKYFGGKVIYLADNDEKKVGLTFYGIEVISLQFLLEIDCKIIISCIHWREIEAQLSDMGIGNRLISLFSFFECSRNRKIWNGGSGVVFIDLFSEAKWGGAEKWNILMANELARKCKKIVVTCTDTVEQMHEYLDELVQIKCFALKNAFEEIVEYYQGQVPLTFVNSFYGENFFAVMAIKRMYPEKVRIINVVHGDRTSVYELAVLFDDWIDQYLCVSSKIKETLIKVYRVLEEKVNFFFQPISLEVSINRRYNGAEPLRIGIASRLVREEKRCDLIPEFIQYLENMHMNYAVNIAGDGELLEVIYSYVVNNNLSEKVKVLGYLDKDQMNDFWLEQDIYINVSEHEGASLSMLEAMGNACVPLVTDVSGVRDYICDGYNGFIFDIGDLHHMAQKARFLDKNRVLLKKMGVAARQEVLSKCRVEDYADKLLNLMDTVL